jgi:anti-sigma factor RsiW
MKPLDPLRLMQHHDGELPPEESAEVERLLSGDPQQRAALAGLEQLGDFLRRFADERGSSADDLVSTVMARLDDEIAPASRRVTRSGVSSRPRRVPTWVWGAAGALAAAAAVALLLPFFAPNGPAYSTGPTAVSAPLRLAAASARSNWPPVGVSTDPVRGPDRGPDVSIETVDFGQRNGTIFMVSSGEGATTPVIWVADSASSNGDRVKPL